MGGREGGGSAVKSWRGHLKKGCFGGGWRGSGVLSVQGYTEPQSPDRI